MKRKIFDYIYFIGWLIRDSVTSFKLTILFYVCFNLASTLSQVAALAIAVQYISGLSSGGETAKISKFGLNFELGANSPYLIGFLLIFSSMGLFLASRLVTRTMRLYEERSVSIPFWIFF
ncbi:MAG: hypothetical protein AAF203_08930 [Pseudomonadota bacterium]